MKIGLFTPEGDGFAGRLETMMLSMDLRIIPAEASDSDKAPDYCLLAGPAEAPREVGAGWKHVGKKAGAFIVVVIDDPSFARPLRANLFRGEGDTHLLLWSRPLRRAAAA